jgi:hypothetical protein
MDATPIGALNGHLKDVLSLRVQGEQHCIQTCQTKRRDSGRLTHHSYESSRLSC